MLSLPHRDDGHRDRMARALRERRRHTRLSIESLERRILLSDDLLGSSSERKPAAWAEIRTAGTGRTSGPRLATSAHQRQQHANGGATAFSVPGNPGQVVPVTFQLQERMAWYRNEIGLFQVDDPSGRIGRLDPADHGYAAAALKRRKVLFSRQQDAGAVTQLDLPAGSYFGIYLIQNSSSKRWFSDNPRDLLNQKPLAFFSFPAANPDRFQHVRQPSPGIVAWEDTTHGGDRDFNDAVVQMTFPSTGPPPSQTQPPPTNPPTGTSIPVVTILGPSAGLATNSNVKIVGLVTDASSPVSTLQAQIDSGSPFSVVFDAEGHYQFATSLPLDGSADGTETVTLRATDAAGNTSQPATVSFVLDTTPPAVTFDLDPASDTAPVGDHQTTLSTVTLDGQTEPDLPVLLLQTGATTTSDSQGRFSFTGVDLVPGDNALTIQATDGAGNQGSFQRTITLVMPPPTFSSLDGWTVQQTGGSSTGQGTVTVEGTDAVLREGDSFRVVLSHPYTVPTTPSQLVFTYSDLSFDTTAVGRIQDAFEAAFVDGAGNPLVHPYAADRDAFFNISETTPETLGAEATVNGQTVSLDLSAVAPGTTGTLILRLVNNDGDTQTSVHINSVQLVDVGQGQPGAAATTSAPASAAGPQASHLVLVADPPVASSPADDGPPSPAPGQVQIQVAATPQATFVGPVMNYKSRADSPFVNAGFYPFYLEDFETHSIAVPGVTAGPPGAGLNSIVYGPDLHSSVDGDDGKIDGSGLDGDDFFSWTGVTTFTFDPKILGSLPTHAGLVWTDGGPNEFLTGHPGGITFQAFDGAGNLLGQVGPVPTPPNHSDVTVDDAIFFGVNYAGGIGSIEMSVNDSAIEVDHLQFGWDHAPPTVTVSTPADGSSIAANTSVLVSGHATSDLAIGVVTVNGQPVDTLDSSGDFFTKVDILPGQNRFTFTAYDAAGGQASTTLTLNGAQQPPGAVDYSLLSDVSASFKGQYARTSFDDDTNVLYADLAIQNTGQYDGDAPLLVGITDLSNPDVKVRDADGVTPDGMPYYDLSSLVTDGTLKPGGATGFRPVSFYNPDRKPFTYDLVFLGVLNQPPQITTVPVVQAIAGKPYTYAAAAIDPDGDPVTYSLAAAPAYLTIDPKTGLIFGTPGTSDIGTQSVLLEADDGRGGTTQQRYVLSVIAPPPNRPPVFTSVPVTDAQVGAAYRYQAVASDPDQDPLTFSVVKGGPQGLAIDPESGLVSWTPTAGQIGDDTVTLQVDDGKGGSAQQTFVIDVQQQAGNHPPAIISAPVTSALAYQTGVDVPYTYLVQAIDPDGDRLTYSLTTAPSGMTIDAQSGQITWNFVQSLGPQNVKVEVADGRGGEDTQSYVLTVVDGQWGTLSGSVFNDQNGDGVQNGFVSVVVPGTSDPWLAGMPDGSTASQEDVAPQESPVQVQGLTLTAGSTLSFSTFGSVNNIPDPSTSGPDGTVNGWTGHSPGVENGISQVIAPINSLVGIFLGPDQPSLTPAPPYLEFENTVPGGIDYTTLSPLLKQVFFIGDGLTSKGQAQQIVVPTGATRLFLGTMDGYGWDDNWGSFFVNISQGGSNEPGLAGWTVYLDQNQNGAHDSGELSTATDVAGKYTFGELPPGSYTVAEEGQPGWQQTGPEGGTYGVTLASGQMAAGLDFGNTQQGVPSGGLPPSFGGPPPPTAVNVGQLFQYQPVVSHSDGATFDLPVKPAGMAVDPGTGVIIWEPTLDEVGLNDMLERVTTPNGQFALLTLQLLVQRVEPPPVITSTPSAPALDGQPYQYQVQAQDAAGDPITFGLDHGPPGMTIDPTTGLLSWPSPSRIYSGVVLNDNPAAYWQLDETSGTIAHDSSPNHVDGTYSANVTLGAPGAIPQDSDTAAQFENSKAVISVPDSPALRPAQLTIEAWVKSDPQNSGTVLMKTSTDLLNDGYGLFYFPYYGSLRFFVNNYQTAEVQAAIPQGQWTYVAATYDGTSLKLYINGTLEGSTPYSSPIVQSTQPLLIGSGQGWPTWVGSLDEVAIYDTALTAGQIAAHYRLATQEVAVTATDAHGGTTTQGFNLGVVAGPSAGPPVITSTPLSIIRLDDTYRYVVQASSPNGSPLTYSLPTAPASMTVDSSGLITWDASQLGDSPVTVRVDDESGGFVTQTFTVEVVPQLSVQAPSIVSMPRVTATVGKPYAYDAQATDPQGAAVTWSLVSAPTGLSINPNLGTLRWTPTLSESGPQAVVVRALDALGASVTQSFTITVSAVVVPPMITSFPPIQASVGQPYFYAVQASDPDGDPLTFSLPTAPASMVIDPASGVIEWTPNVNQVGSQQAEVKVTTPEGDFRAQEFTIVVTPAAPPLPPVITSAAPMTATMNEPYQYQVTATDPQNETLQYSLQAGPSGTTINPKSGLLQWTPGQAGQVPFTVAATDTDGLVATQSYTLTVKGPNHPPTISSTAAASVTAGLTYQYDVQASDPDGDSLTYQLDSGPQGASIDSFGRLAWPTTAADVGSQSFQITVSDGQGGSVDQTFDVTVTADTEAPQVSVSLSSNPADIGSTVTFVVSTTDNVGVAGLMLTVGGTPVALDTQGLANMTVKTAGQLAVVATATDAAGNQGTATDSLLVIDPSITGAPTVDLPDLPNNGVITAPVTIMGTVNDSNLLSYTLEVGSVDGGDFHQIASGTSPVTNGVLGTLDPTMLANGPYILRLTATNAGGKTATEDANFSVMGNLKLGNFTQQFDDLAVLVSGVPITVTRIYNTLNADESADFGYGWSLDYRDTDLQTSVPKTGDEADGLFNPFVERTRVYVTLPGGQREGFTFEPTEGSAFLTTYFTPNFVPDPGVTDQLTVEGESSNQGELSGFEDLAGQGGTITLFQQDDGSYADGDQIPYNPADDLFGGKYFVTTKDGTKYQIDGLSGLLDSVTDLNGNTLSFSSNGITSSAGPAVTFSRDPEGRITAVTDPAGKQILYQYDGQGNLVAVTDRDGNATKFVYDTTPAHYLDEVIDPLGRMGTRTDYDSQGRLIGVTDGNGQTINLSFDPRSSSETVADRLGNPTTYVYDNRGNILIEVDPLGGVTRRTFDANNNMLSVTDPSGNMTTFTYDATGNLLTQTDALGNMTRFAYDGLSQLLTLTNPLGATETMTYDASENLTSLTDPMGNVTKYTYDARGDRTSSTDALSNTTLLHYDASGDLVKQTDPLGHSISYTYDAAGRLLSTSQIVTGPDGPAAVVTTRVYDAAGHLISVTNPDGGVTRTVYDAAGEKVAETDPLGRVTRYVYDDNGNLIETDLPGDGAAPGPLTRSEYDADGHMTAAVDEEGRRTEYVYDKLGRLVETIEPGSNPADPTGHPTMQTQYNAVGAAIAVVDEDGNRTQREFDADGHLTEVTDALGGMTISTLDAAGHMLSQTDPLGNSTKYVYDALGLVTEIDYPDGTSEKFTYNAVGKKIAMTDQAGRVTEYGYDALGQLTSVTDPLGQKTLYGYDELGDLISQTDADGNVTRYEYDTMGRQTAVVQPAGERSTTTYDDAGDVVSTTDANGATITYDYDSRGELTATNFPDGTSVTYTYTPTGQRATVTDARGVTTYQYDDNDQLVARIDPDGSTISYGYDAAGDETSVKTPAGTTTYTYTALGQIATVIVPDGGVTRYTYDADGNLVKTQTPDGIIETRTYDTLNRLTSIEDTGPAGTIFSERYTLSSTGLRDSAMDDDGRMVNYTYDSLGRLIDELINDPTSGKRDISYDYDPAGNRLTMNDSAEGLTTYNYDSDGRLMTQTLDGSATTYKYDADGNLLSVTSAAGTVLYEWDFEDRLIGASTKGDGTYDVTIGYDADGNRVSETVDGVTTRFLVDTQTSLSEILLEYTPAGAIVSSYVYGNALIMRDHDGQPSYYHADGLGSTRVLTDARGAVTDRYTYDAYGRVLAHAGSSDNVYLFAGEPRDPFLGLDYDRARYYDPSVGVFTTRDFAAPVLTMPLTANKYLYADADPANLVDPTGLEEQGSLAGTSTTLAIVDDLASTVDGVSNSLYAGLNVTRTVLTGAGEVGETLIVPTGGTDFVLSFILGTNAVYILATALSSLIRRLLGTVPVLLFGELDLPQHSGHVIDAQTGNGSGPFGDPVFVGALFTRKIPSNSRSWLRNLPALAVCGTNRRARGVQCDEFGFASTYEGGGANFLAGNVSIRAVSAQEDQGSVISGFYNTFDVEDSDPFIASAYFGLSVGFAIDTSGNLRVVFL
jgi:RHS repeat-associated protein